MEPTSITPCLETAGAGGIGSMRRGDTVLEGLESEAREGRKGLWVDPQPVPPWEWRKLGRALR